MRSTVPGCFKKLCPKVDPSINSNQLFQGVPKQPPRGRRSRLRSCPKRGQRAQQDGRPKHEDLRQGHHQRVPSPRRGHLQRGRTSWSWSRIQDCTSRNRRKAGPVQNDGRLQEKLFQGRARNPWSRLGRHEGLLQRGQDLHEGNPQARHGDLEARRGHTGLEADGRGRCRRRRGRGFDLRGHFSGSG